MIETINAANPEAVEAQEKKLKRGRSQATDDMADILKLPQGRRMLWRFLEHCKVFESVFSLDRSVMAANAGKQDVGHFILSEVIKADESAFMTMMKEAHEEKK